MSTMEMPANVAAAPRWQPAYVTPPSSTSEYQAAETDQGSDSLSQPRRMPSGTPNQGETQPVQ